MQRSKIRVAFYPRTVFSWSNPLWRVLKGALSGQDVEVADMRFSFFDILRRRKRIKIIHFHYVYPEVSRGDYAYLPKRIWNKAYRFIVGYQNKTFGMKLRVAKALGYKIVYTVHNLDFHQAPGSDMRKNLALMYNMADSIIVMGKATAGKVTELTGRKDVKLIPPFHFVGIYENTVTKQAAREKLGIPPDKFVYLFFGSIMRYKGVDILIRIFKKLGADTVLLIAGDMSPEPQHAGEIRNLIRGDSRVTVAEYRFPGDIQFFMNAADIAVFPFRQITNSSAVMLAKSFSKPTICMDKGNIADYANPAADILARDETGLEKALIEARQRVFPEGKEGYLKGIPGPEEVARMHREIYEG